MKTIQKFVQSRLIYLAILAWILVMVSQLLGRWWWFAELFSHFLPYAVLSWALAMLVARGKWRIWWALWAVLGGLWVWYPFYPQDALQHQTGQLIWYNVHLNNPQPEAETQRLLASQPDVLALAEMDVRHPHWQTLRQAMPFGCEHESDSPFALALWSRQPLASCEVKFVADLPEGYPYIRATWSQANTVVYALHPPPPIGGTLAHHRQRYLAAVAQDIQQEKAVLVVGDLNSTPYSPIFRDFVAQAQLHPHTHRHLSTWHLGLNIDHVLSRFAPKRHVLIQPLDWGTSDHRALRVVLEK